MKSSEPLVQNQNTFYRKGPNVEISVTVPNESDDLLNDTPISSPSRQVEMAMSWVCHFNADIIHTGNFHKKHLGLNLFIS